MHIQEIYIGLHINNVKQIHTARYLTYNYYTAVRRQNTLFRKIFKMHFMYNPIFLYLIFCIIQYPMFIVPLDRLPLN